MKERFYNDPEDIEWLRTSHLRGLSAEVFQSFCLWGNEDCPDRIVLYAAHKPMFDDSPVAVYVWGGEAYRPAEE